jgi:nascent polypeptide-associated complex subunit alpha
MKASASDPAGAYKQCRSEKQLRKAVQTLGLMPVPGVTRVTIKKDNNNTLVISKPDVFKSPASDTHIIFGEAKIEDLSAQAQAAAGAAAAAGKRATGVANRWTPAEVAELQRAADAQWKAPGAAEEEEAAPVDESGIEPRDIELVMVQAGVSRAAAVSALKSNAGDLVSAIMELTM